MIEVITPTQSELEALTKRESLRHTTTRKQWALEVLELVQTRPNEWLKLKDKHNGANATRYLKPLGISYSITEIEPNGFATFFVKWASK